MPLFHLEKKKGEMKKKILRSEQTNRDYFGVPDF
jgi:hypothetical protein